MACALALPAALWMSLLAGPDLELGLRVEGRAAAFTPSGTFAPRRASGVATPSAGLAIEDGGAQLTAGYQARIWSSDLELGLTPLVTHTLDARLDLRRPDRLWRLDVSASAEEGTYDTLSDPFRPIQAGGPYVAAAGPAPYRRLQGGAHVGLDLDARTTATAGASAETTTGTTPVAREIMPPQRVVYGDAELVHRLTDRDTLRVHASSEETWTDASQGQLVGLSGVAAVEWRRRLNPRLDGWIDAGSGFTSREGEPRTLLPVAEVGLALGEAVGRPSGSASAGFTTYVDRGTGRIVPIAEARLAAAWNPTEHVNLSAHVAARRTTDGASTLGFGEAWMRWSVRARLSLETGLVGRWQRETVARVTAYDALAVVLAATYRTGRL